MVGRYPTSTSICRVLCIVAASAVALGACLTPSGDLPPESGPEGTVAAGDARSDATAHSPPAGPQAGPPAEKLDAALNRAEASLDLGNYADAMREYARLVITASRTPQADFAESELERFGDALLIEPSSEWMGADGAQRALPVRQLASGEEALPAVIVTVSEGPARVAVHALTVRFSWFAGERRLGDFSVPTSEFGTARSPVPADTPSTANLRVTARPVVDIDGHVVPIGVASVEFRYRAPETLVLALTGAVLDNEVQAVPGFSDALTAGLNPMGGLVVADASNRAEYIGALSLQADSVEQVLDESGTALLALAALDVQNVNQMEYQGKLYDIWRADGIVRFSVLDGIDGSTLMSIAGEPVSGQGGNASAALSDLSAIASQSLEALLIAHTDELAKLTGIGE